MLKNMSVGSRISFGFAFILLTMVVLTVVGMIQVNKINAALTLINDVNGVKERYAINFRGSVHDRSIAIRDVTLVPAAELPAVVSHIEQLEDVYRQNAGPLDALFAAGTNISDAERRQLEKLKASEQKAMPLVHEIIKMQEAGRTSEAQKEVLDRARPAFVEWLASINGLINLEEKLSQEQGVTARAVGLDFQRLMLMLTLIATTIGIFLAVLTTRSLIHPLKEMMGVLEAAADGDLTKRSDANRRDELGQMGGVLNEALESTRGALVQVNGMIGGLLTVSQDLTSAAEALQASSVLQATGLSTTTANLEQVTSIARETADYARSATLLASGECDPDHDSGRSAALAQPTSGEGVSAVGAMLEINHASTRIATIVSVVESIAFQTSLLALNAAVEAAHAGEEGEGFAVVAGEVKTLAQRSSDSAAEIKEQIEDSMRKVNRGSELVDRVTVLIRKIAAASQTQSSGIEKVGKSVMDMDNITKTNSMAAEKLTVVARSLSSEACELRNTLAHFQV